MAEMSNMKLNMELWTAACHDDNAKLTRLLGGFVCELTGRHDAGEIDSQDSVSRCAGKAGCFVGCAPLASTRSRTLSPSSLSSTGGLPFRDYHAVLQSSRRVPISAPLDRQTAALVSPYPPSPPPRRRRPFRCLPLSSPPRASAHPAA